MSTVKTQINSNEVHVILNESFDSDVKNIAALPGGEMSQAFSFRSNKDYLVVRFYKESTSFYKDRYAYDNFGNSLPIPKTLTINKYNDLYYSITEFVEGRNLKEWGIDVQKKLINEQIRMLKMIHNAQPKNDGFGWWDKRGIATNKSWQESLSKKMEHVKSDFVKLNKSHAKEREDVEIVYEKMMGLVPEMPNLHYLIHGDYGFDNLISDGNKITAVLDFGNSQYGDFLYDVAWLDLWEPEIGYKEICRKHYQNARFDVTNYENRIKCYQLHMGLGALGFFVLSEQEDKYKYIRKRIFELI